MGYAISDKKQLLFCVLVSASLLGGQQDQESPAPEEIDQLRKLGSTTLIQPTVLAKPRLRTSLEERGVSAGLSYLAEGFSNWRGGRDSRRGVAYLGSFVSTISLDFRKLGIARGGFFMSGQVLHGRGINDAKVGAIQAVSNLDAEQFNRFVEAWYSDSYLEGKLRLKAGRQYADADFGVIENGADFLNSSYGLIPTTPMPTYPEPETGVSVWYVPAGWISWGGGIFRGGTLKGGSEENGMLRKGAFGLLETKIEPFPKQSSQRGSYHLGIWQQANSTWLSKPQGETSSPVRNYGLYATADHWFLRNTMADESGGPGVFFQWGWSPSDRNEVTGYTGGGFLYQGLIPQRRGDSCGVGVTKARLHTADSETVLELFYKVRAGRVMIQPDLQWFQHPGGDGPMALVAGLRMGIEF